MKTPNGDFVHNISISYLAHEVLQSLDRPDRKRHEELKSMKIIQIGYIRILTDGDL